MFPVHVIFILGQNKEVYFDIYQQLKIHLSAQKIIAQVDYIFT